MAEADCSLPQAGQVVHRDVPQTWQKRAPSETFAPHDGQEPSTLRV